MATENLTPEALTGLQNELERSRSDNEILLVKVGELASAFGILRTAIENEPGPAADLARILEEYTCDLVDAARKRTA
ncbi:MAG: hypothetical protein JSS47_08355 [Proteobacteria bacterium]|nr:hypothetical protein [Pseudomonadota bacterium]